MQKIIIFTAACALVLYGAVLVADDSKFQVDGNQLLKQFFESETDKVARRSLADINTQEDWQSRRPEHLEQLKEMLGLSPWPQKTELKATVTGTSLSGDVVAEKVHFQSMPGLYVTGTFFRPQEQSEPLPAILYVCGHGRVKENGVSYGNKATYQHHGAWFAKNGYVCLMIDTIQLGEIEGIHHGTYREEMWWWHNHGYTPAGVEAWNGIRSIDYLQSRPEVDGERIGITGRSGGGAYSWWVAALDERIKAAVPVAGITSMQNHIVDGCIEGHCDCMYMVNTYAWDFPQLAAMVAPRPLLISNTDKDRIFPLDGVVDVYSKTRRIYELHDAVGNIGLNIAEGPHKDTQQLRVNAFHWFNRFLKNEEPLIETTATKLFEPKELKVFDEIPDDERVTSIQQSFVPLADEKLPKTQAELDALQERVLAQLRNKTFRNVDLDANPKLKKIGSWRNGKSELTLMTYKSGDVYELPLYILKPDASVQTTKINFVICDDRYWQYVHRELGVGFPNCPTLATNSILKWLDTQLLRSSSAFPDECQVFCVPRGIGPTEWTASQKEEIHIKRRMALLGHTVDGLRIYDIVQALRALRTFSSDKIIMASTGKSAEWMLFAAIFSPWVSDCGVHDIQVDFRDGPHLLNVSRILTKKQLFLIAANSTKKFTFSGSAEDQKELGIALDEHAQKLGWPKERVQFGQAIKILHKITEDN